MEPAVAQEQVNKVVAHGREQLAKVIVGQHEMIEQCLVALLTGGHVLLEGVPGVAKTLAVKTLSQLFQLSFQRIQCTSDLMPADIIGTNILDQENRTFALHKGPIFGDLILVDEVNRMPPRTQAALLEAMEERQITIDGKRYPLNPLFTVFATQNPVDFEGTYPLPEAQLDRFLLKVLVPYPTEQEEQAILALYAKGGSAAVVEPLPTEVLAAARAKVVDLNVQPDLVQYAVRLTRATRESPQLALGASPRASLNLLYVGKAYAAMDGRDYLIPDDLKRAVPPVLRHRMMLKPEAQLEGVTPDQVLTEVIKHVAVPR
ncbi:MAG: AAA family ATPase [Terriglobales bacterium]|jgi:MoxR-like ATPase